MKLFRFDVFFALLCASLFCANVPARAAAWERTVFEGHDAFRLSDGRSEAVVVPSLGRVMRYGFVGGPNLLWTNRPAPLEKPSEWDWANWGGDKSWPAPQGLWRNGKGWPPHANWDGKPHEAEPLADGKLRLKSGIWPELGVSLTRDYGFNAAGEFVINQTFTKEFGAPVQLSLWSITQVKGVQSAWALTDPQSTYKDNFHLWDRAKTIGSIPPVDTSVPGVLRMQPGTSSGYKIGVDSPVASLAAVFSDVALVQRSARPKGQYPDGAATAGFPVEFYSTGTKHVGPAGPYMELELLSPLRPFSVGTQWTHSVYWSLHALPPNFQNAPDAGFIIRLLRATS